MSVSCVCDVVLICQFQYVKREVAKFFGVDVASEERERVKWSERQKRLALRRFGSLKQVGINSLKDFPMGSFSYN